MQPTDKTTKNSLDQPPDYPLLLAEVKERIRSAQYEALKAVNKELVGLYWDIGRLIVERQECPRLGQGGGGAVIRRSAAGISRRGWVFGAEPLVHATILLGISGQ